MSTEEGVVQLQWIKGDKQGNVEIVDDTVDNWTVFKSGNRIDTSLINEFMAPVNGEPLDFSPTKTVSKTVSRSPKKEVKKSPIRLLFEKQKEFEKDSLCIEIPIEIPKNAIYDLLTSTFDGDEVRVELESFILDQIPNNELNSIIKGFISELIQSKYSS